MSRLARVLRNLEWTVGEVKRLRDVLSFYTAAIDPHQTEATADWDLTDVRWRQRIDEMHKEIERLKAKASDLETENQTLLVRVDNRDNEIRRLRAELCAALRESG